MENDMPELDGSTVVLTDEEGRKLPCLVEQTLEVDSQVFLLLLPVDAPIELFIWQSEDDDEDEVLVDVEEAEIDPLFPTARAVLAELDLLLQRSAYTLTAAGELPEAEEDDCFTLELSDDGEDEMTTEEFQMLATFFHEDEQYTLCTPLEPLLFFAQRQANGEVTLVSPEAFQSVRSQLEDKLFDVLD